jgi:hypothetical protein
MLELSSLFCVAMATHLLRCKVHSVPQCFSAAPLIAAFQASVLAKIGTVFAMPRVTLSVADREHMALKLLALQRNQKMVAIIELAIRQYLENEGAYDLVIQSVSHQDDKRL